MTADDDFERLLARCRAQLDSISLHLPAMEGETSAPQERAPSPGMQTPPPAPPPPTPPPEPARVEITAVKPAPAAAATARQTIVSVAPAPEAPPPVVAIRESSPASPRFDPPPAPLPDLTPPPSPPRRFVKPRAAPAAPPSWRPAAYGLAALAAGAGLWWWQRPPLDRPFSLAASDAAALRPPRADILVAQGSTLLDLTEDGRVIARSALPSPVTAIGWQGGYLWSVDGRSRMIKERRDGAEQDTVFAVNFAPARFCLHGRQLWALEPDGRVVRQYLISRSLLGVQLQPLDEYRLPGIEAAAIALDDAERLWVADRASARLLRLTREGPGYRLSDSASLADILKPGAEVRSLDVLDGQVWLLASQPDGRSTMHRLSADRLGWKTP